MEKIKKRKAHIKTVTCLFGLSRKKKIGKRLKNFRNIVARGRRGGHLCVLVYSHVVSKCQTFIEHSSDELFPILS